MASRIVAASLLAVASAQSSLPACACNTYSNFSPGSTYATMCLQTLQSGGNQCTPKYSDAHGCDSGHIACSFNRVASVPAPPPTGSAGVPPASPAGTTCSDRAGSKKATKCAKANVKKCGKSKFAAKCCGSCQPYAAEASDPCADTKRNCASKASKCERKLKIRQKCPTTCHYNGCGSD